MFLLMLAVQTTLNSVLDIQTLFLVSVMGGQHSDAKNMEGMTGIPAIVWSLLWGVIALAILHLLALGTPTAHRKQRESEAKPRYCRI